MIILAALQIDTLKTLLCPQVGHYEINLASVAPYYSNYVNIQWTSAIQATLGTTKIGLIRGGHISRFNSNRNIYIQKGKWPD